MLKFRISTNEIPSNGDDNSKFTRKFFLFWCWWWWSCDDDDDDDDDDAKSDETLVKELAKDVDDVNVDVDERAFEDFGLTGGDLGEWKGEVLVDVEVVVVDVDVLLLLLLLDNDDFWW